MQHLGRMKTAGIDVRTPLLEQQVEGPVRGAQAILTQHKRLFWMRIKAGLYIGSVYILVV